jgi:uncharacterized damage-inducible protein DinB
MTPDQASFLVSQYAQLMQGEFPATCKVLRAVKDDNRDYKPDPKSRSAWELAVHLATGDIWFLDAVLNGSFAWDPVAAKKAEGMFTNAAELAAFYEKTFPEKLKAVQALSEADLTRTVDFFGMFQWPAVNYLGFANNHSIHHRGQLAAYLRAMGSKVPAIYGGSADEPMPS